MPLHKRGTSSNNGIYIGYSKMISCPQMVIVTRLQFNFRYMPKWSPNTQDMVICFSLRNIKGEEETTIKNI